MDSKKNLEKAYKELAKILKKKGITLPTDDTGAFSYNPDQQEKSRVIYFPQDALDWVKQRAGLGYHDNRTLAEQELALRALLNFLTPIEQTIVIDRLVHNHTFKKIGDSLPNFSGAKNAFTIYKVILLKIRKKAEQDDEFVKNLRNPRYPYSES